MLETCAASGAELGIVDQTKRLPAGKDSQQCAQRTHVAAPETFSPKVQQECGEEESAQQECAKKNGPVAHEHAVAEEMVHRLGYRGQVDWSGMRIGVPNSRGHVLDDILRSRIYHAGQCSVQHRQWVENAYPMRAEKAHYEQGGQDEVFCPLPGRPRVGFSEGADLRLSYFAEQVVQGAERTQPAAKHAAKQHRHQHRHKGEKTRLWYRVRRKPRGGKNQRIEIEEYVQKRRRTIFPVQSGDEAQPQEKYQNYDLDRPAQPYNAS